MNFIVLLVLLFFSMTILTMIGSFWYLLHGEAFTALVMVAQAWLLLKIANNLQVVD